MTTTKILHILIIIGLTLPRLGFSNTLDDITFMTEIYPPYNFKEKNMIKGISVDVLELMFKKLDSNKTRKDIKILPWARSYFYLQNNKNTALFSMTRTQKRENIFKWVGPITSTTISLIAKKSQHIKITSNKDMLNYKIGAVRDDIGEQLLIDEGILPKQIEDVGGVDALFKLIKMFDRDRFDMLAYEESVTKWEQKRNGFDPDKYEVVFQLKKGFLYFAFHKETPTQLINELQNILNEIKKEGRVQEIVKKYLH